MKSDIKILALDDDAKFLSELKTALETEFTVRTATEVSKAMEAIKQYRPNILLLDVNMPEVTGLQFLKVVRQRVPDLPVIMLTGDGRTEMIVSAIKAGASDYVVKGSEDFFEGLQIRIGQALVITEIKSKLREEQSRYEILGIAPSTIRLRADLTRYKGTNAYILILGENGTGKELVARTLNIQENEPGRPFCAVNCGAIPHNLFESELFGHMKGSFSGAVTDQVGKFAIANGGDLFLDEIGDLPLNMQVKLLRALQEKIITPIGSNKDIKVDVRVIAATNRKLEDLVREGKFREDLYYRINQLPVVTTPLRERKEDISYLAKIFVEKRLPGVSLSKEAIKKLEEHPWPGNIRELDNIIERACIFARGTGNKILPEHLILTDMQSAVDAILPSGLLPQNAPQVTKDRYQQCMDWMQKLFIEKSLPLLLNNNLLLIERIGISKGHYYERKKELGIGTQDSRWM